MSNRIQIEKRVIQAAERTLYDQHYVCAIDILVNPDFDDFFTNILRINDPIFN